MGLLNRREEKGKPKRRWKNMDDVLFLIPTFTYLERGEKLCKNKSDRNS